MPKYTLKTSDGASYTLDSPNELTQDQLNTAFSEALQQSQPTQQQAPQQQQPAKEPRTTASGLLAAAGRGAAPYAAAATLGAVTAGPLGAAAAPTALLAADVLTPVANYALGTNYPSPSDSIQNLLTRAGTPQPKTETERVVQAASGGASGQKAFIGLGKTLAGSANPLSQRVGQVLSESPLAQYFSGGAAGGASQFAAEEGASPLQQTIAGFGAGLLPNARSLLKSGVRAIGEAVTPSASPVVPPKTIKEIYRGAKLGASPSKQKDIAQVLTEDPLSADAARYKLYNGKPVVDNQAINAINQGWQDSAVSAIKASSLEDKIAMKQMLDVFKTGEKNVKYRSFNRPSDTIGQTVENQINYLSKLKNEAGISIDDIAKKELKGKTVDVKPAMDSFLKELDDIGVSLKTNKSGILEANLRNSEIQGDKQSQSLLNGVLERLYDVNVPDGLGVHRAKRFLDTQISYGKKVSNPLSERSEMIVKNLRRNLNEALRKSSKNYKKMNTQYSETIDALTNLQKSVGSNVDFNSPNADKALGTFTRKTLSNQTGRVNAIDALDLINKTAKSYGYKSNADVTNQIIFANELEKMFGSSADTSLKGQMEQVGQTVQIGANLARGNLAQTAINLASKGINKLQGVNRENAVKTMESLLQQETLKTKK